METIDWQILKLDKRLRDLRLGLANLYALKSAPFDWAERVHCQQEVIASVESAIGKLRQGRLL